MKKLQLLAAMGFICLSAAQSHAAGREFNDLLYFEGIWQCEGKALDAATNIIRDVSSVYTVNATLDASWLQTTMFESQDNVSIQVSSRMVGYDTTWKRYVSYEVGRQGAWSFLSTADSWSSKMHWTGYLHNFQGHVARDVEESVRRVSEDAFNWVSHARDVSGKWFTLYDGSCHRQMH